MHKKGRILRNFCFVLFLLLCVNLGYAKLEIIVKSTPDWGPIADADMETLCQNIVDHFEVHLRLENEINEKVIVCRSPTDRSASWVGLNPEPGIKYKIGVSLSKEMEIRVDNFSFFIFPFAHELCHILHNFDKTYKAGNPNLWFQEGISMMAGVWALRSMAKTWEDESPFGAFVRQDGALAYFSTNFNFYADVYFNRGEYTGTGAEWLKEHENTMRVDNPFNNKNVTHFDYKTIAQLTYKFLPIFEENPVAWNIVRKMPATKGKMSEYMQDWYDAVDEQDKQYVEAIAEVMGIRVAPFPIVDSIPENAESVSLTFMHRSDTSLTPINDPSDWDGWVAGIWEKTPDGQISKKSNHYYNFQGMDIWSHWAYSSAPATIEYDISSGAYTKFSSYFGVPHQGPDYACLGGPSMQLVAYADNIEIYRSDVLYRDNHGAYIEFDVPSKTKTLKLEIGDVENQHCDNYIFGEPKLYTDSAAGLEAGNIDADVNNDGRVDLLDVQIVRKAINGSSNYDTDVNNDGVTDEADIFIVKAFAHAAIVAASPGKRKVNITTWGNLKRR